MEEEVAVGRKGGRVGGEMEKEKRKKKSYAASGAVDDSPIKPKAGERQSTYMTPSKSSRRTWSPSDFAGGRGEELEEMLAAEAARGA